MSKGKQGDEAVAFCPDAFWDGELAWREERPELTDCFQGTVLVIVPCLFLWLFLPYYIKLGWEIGSR